MLFSSMPVSMTAPGPDGPVPTVRVQMFREAVQEAEAWLTIVGTCVDRKDDEPSAADARRLLGETGCAGVMIGRAAMERPWIYREIARGWGLQVPPLRLRTRGAVYRRLAKLLRAHYAHPRDLYRLREFTGYFAKNYAFGHQLWKDVQNAPDAGAARKLARDFFARQEDAGETLS